MAKCSEPSDAWAEGEPAVRDAAGILARVAADEAAADEARQRYRLGPIPPIQGGPMIQDLLEPGEFVVATRAWAVIDRGTETELGTATSVAGMLSVTSRRLLLTGRVRLSIGLDEIREILMAGDRLLLVLRGGQGVSLEVAYPRLLRVELAAARVAARA